MKQQPRQQFAPPCDEPPRHCAPALMLVTACEISPYRISGVATKATNSPVATSRPCPVMRP